MACRASAFNPIFDLTTSFKEGMVEPLIIIATWCLGFQESGQTLNTLAT
jgi:hypothetical protein